MTIKHHPSEGSLLSYAAGTLTSGPALALAIHIASCATCRAQVADFEAIGGSLFEGMHPEPVEPAALSNTLRRIDSLKSCAPPRSPGPPLRDGTLELPSPLRNCRLGRWQWLGPGIRWKRVALPWDSDANVVLLKVAAGRSLPWHTHIGTEFTQVLHGSFSHDRGRYALGDMDEADADVEHQPVVDRESECICLAALDGCIRIRGRVGRMLNFFIGF